MAETETKTESKGGRFLQRLKQRWFLLILCALIGGAAAALVTRFVLPPVCSSTATMLLSSATAEDKTVDEKAEAMEIRDASLLITGREVLEAVKEELSLDLDVEKLRRRIRIENPEKSHVLYLTASMDTPEMAKAVVDSLAKHAADFLVRSLDMPKPKVIEEGNSSVVKEYPDMAQNTVLGLIIGFFVCLLLTLTEAGTKKKGTESGKQEENVAAGTEAALKMTETEAATTVKPEAAAAAEAEPKTEVETVAASEPEAAESSAEEAAGEKAEASVNAESKAEPTAAEETDVESAVEAESGTEEKAEAAEAAEPEEKVTGEAEAKLAAAAVPEQEEKAEAAEAAEPEEKVTGEAEAKPAAAAVPEQEEKAEAATTAKPEEDAENTPLAVMAGRLAEKGQKGLYRQTRKAEEGSFPFQISENGKTLEEYLAGKVEKISEIIRRTDQPNLYVICSGTGSEEMDQKQMQAEIADLAEAAKKVFDIVLVEE